MAKAPKHIDSNLADTSMDYTALLELGLEYIMQYSSEEWTNYNESDPGITFLETLCYALTDLGYRTNFSIPDILTTKQDEHIHAGENAFYTPSQIFPVNPVTPDDYRKLLLSNIPELQNTWMTPLPPQEKYGYINGLYEVQLQLDKDTGNPGKIIHLARALLNQHRNLCEDYQSIKTINHKEIRLKANIYIEANADPDKVKAEVIQAVNSFFNQIVPRYSREELLAEGYTLSQIYEGSIQHHGFIKTEELFPMRACIYRGELTQLIHDIEDVIKVEEVQLCDPETNMICPDPYPTEGLILWLPSNEETVIIIQDNTIINTSPSMVSYYYNQLATNFIRKYAIALEETPVEIPQGQYRDIAYYFSFQRELSHIYHVGEDELGNNISDSRQAQAKQLKAYLLFFDQFLADYLSQLAHTKQLFSIEHDISQTYFYQVPENVPRLDEVVVSHFPQHLKEVMNAQDPFFKRRDQFARHLLARFAERLPAETIDLIHNKTDQQTANKRKQFLQNKVRLELDFLQRYVPLSRNRGKAYDYLNVSYKRRDWSGLHHRLNLFLDYPDTPFYIIENILLRPSKLLTTYAFFNILDESSHILLENYGFIPPGKMRKLLKKLPKITSRPSNFRIYKNPARKAYLPYHIYLYNEEQIVAQYPLRFAKKKEAKEKLYLLRTIFKKPWEDRFTIEKNKISANYFSNRLTIVLPEWDSLPFSENIFKDLVIDNTPSHLAVCYRLVNDQDINLFIEYYNAWLLAQEGRSDLDLMNIDDAASQLIQFLLLNKNYRSCIEIIPDESFFYS